MLDKLKMMLVFSVLVLIGIPAQARADAFVMPWVGTAFGNSFHNGQASVGATAGGMGDGIFGGEVDFGYSPSFFGTTSDFGHNTVIDLMGNLIIGVPVGGTHGPGIRPYATAGLGLLRTQIDGGTLTKVSSSNDMAGWDAGAGVMGYFNDHVGLGGDVRYVRGFKNTNTGVTTFDVNGAGELHYWRASIGVVFR